MSFPYRVARAAWAQIDSLAELIADAYGDLPLLYWLAPDPHRREAVLAGYARIWVEHALFHGEVEVLTDRSAVAVWIHRSRPLPPPASYTQRRAAVCGVNTVRFEELDHLLDARHPAERHQQLVFLAVVPEKRGAGRATDLLDWHHTGLDATGVAAFTHAPSEAARKLYARHGYTERGTLRLPDGSTTTSMWRPAQT